MNLIEKIRGYKTYATAAVTALTCAVLYYLGTPVDGIVAVGIAGIMGGIASLRDAVAKQDKGKDIAGVLGKVDAALEDE